MTRFGLQGADQFPAGLPDASYFGDVAALAETAGFDSIWVGDHVSYGNPILDPFVVLATFAAHIRLGDDTASAEAAALDHLLTRYHMTADAARRYCIVGDPDAAVTRVRDHLAAGVEHLVFVPIGEPDELLDQARRIAADVVTAFAGERAGSAAGAGRS